MSSHPRGAAILNQASAIPENMVDQPEHISFRNQFLPELNVFCRQTESWIETAQDHYKWNFEASTITFDWGRHSNRDGFFQWQTAGADA